MTPKRILMLVYLAALVTIILSSCYTEKKAAKQVNKALDKKPLVVAKIARDAFPCTTTKEDTLLITKDTTIYIECPEIDNTGNDYLPIHDTVKVLTNSVKTKIVRVPVTLPVQTRYITKTIEDSAKIKIAYAEVQEANKQIDELTAKVARKNKTLMWLWILIGGIAIGIIVKLKFF